MPLEQELNDLLKDSMRAKDQRTSNVVRMLKTKVMERRTSKGFTGEVTDEIVREVIAAYKKQVQKAIAEYSGAGDKGKEQVEELTFEMSFCDRFLPKGLSEDDLKAAVQAAITRLGASDVKMAGRIVGEVMKEHKGTVEAADVKRIAEALLAPK